MPILADQYGSCEPYTRVPIEALRRLVAFVRQNRNLFVELFTSDRVRVETQEQADGMALVITASDPVLVQQIKRSLPMWVDMMRTRAKMLEGQGFGPAGPEMLRREGMEPPREGMEPSTRPEGVQPGIRRQESRRERRNEQESEEQESE